MYHFLYKTTNTVNGKYYIGVHSTNDLNDGYRGSGVALKDAIKKHGLDCFVFEILEFFESREEAFVKEASIVSESFVQDSQTYNLTTGGMGGVVKTEDFKQLVSEKLKGRIFTDEHRRKISLAQTGEKNHRYGKPNPNTPKLYGEDNGMYGKTHSEESKKKMSESRKKAKVDYDATLRQKLSDACKGKLWYNNGYESRRFIEGTQPNGFVKGRISATKIRKEMGIE